MSCTNHLKQFTLAMHNYGDVNDAVFPAGARGTIVCTWAHFIMPFVEMQASYAQWQPQVRYDCAVNKYGVHNSLAFANSNYNATVANAGPRMDIHTCPSDSNHADVRAFRGYNYKVCVGNTAVYGMTGSGANTFVQNGHGWVTELSDGTVTVRSGGACFSMVRGDDVTVPTYTQLGIPSSSSGSIPNRWYGFGPGGVPFSSITDGMSNTLCMSESKTVYFDGTDSVGAGYDLRGWVVFGPSALFSAFLPPNSSEGDLMSNKNYCTHDEPGFPCLAVTKTMLDVDAPAGNTANQYYYRGARSYHPGGISVSLADGSVRFISDTINIAAWREAASAYGGGVTNL
jgi:hypothetical protein